MSDYPGNVIINEHCSIAEKISAIEKDSRIIWLFDNPTDEMRLSAIFGEFGNSTITVVALWPYSSEEQLAFEAQWGHPPASVLPSIEWADLPEELSEKAASLLSPSKRSEKPRSGFSPSEEARLEVLRKQEESNAKIVNLALDPKRRALIYKGRVADIMPLSEDEHTFFVDCWGRTVYEAFGIGEVRVNEANASQKRRALINSKLGRQLAVAVWLWPMTENELKLYRSNYGIIAPYKLERFPGVSDSMLEMLS